MEGANNKKATVCTAFHIAMWLSKFLSTYFLYIGNTLIIPGEQLQTSYVPYTL